MFLGNRNFISNCKKWYCFEKFLLVITYLCRKKYVSRFHHSYRLRYRNHTSFIFNISHVGFNGFFFFFSLLTSWPHFWSAFRIGAELHSLFECRTEYFSYLSYFEPGQGQDHLRLKIGKFQSSKVDLSSVL